MLSITDFVFNRLLYSASFDYFGNTEDLLSLNSIQKCFTQRFGLDHREQFGKFPEKSVTINSNSNDTTFSKMDSEFHLPITNVTKITNISTGNSVALLRSEFNPQNLKWIKLVWSQSFDYYSHFLEHVKSQGVFDYKNFSMSLYSQKNTNVNYDSINHDNVISEDTFFDNLFSIHRKVLDHVSLHHLGNNMSNYEENQVFLRDSVLTPAIGLASSIKSNLNHFIGYDDRSNLASSSSTSSSSSSSLSSSSSSSSNDSGRSSLSSSSSGIISDINKSGNSFTKSSNTSSNNNVFSSATKHTRFSAVVHPYQRVFDATLPHMNIIINHVNEPLGSTLHENNWDLINSFSFILDYLKIITNEHFDVVINTFTTRLSSMFKNEIENNDHIMGVIKKLHIESNFLQQYDMLTINKPMYDLVNMYFSNYASYFVEIIKSVGLREKYGDDSIKQFFKTIHIKSMFTIIFLLFSLLYVRDKRAKSFVLSNQNYSKVLLSIMKPKNTTQSPKSQNLSQQNHQHENFINNANQIKQVPKISQDDVRLLDTSIQIGLELYLGIDTMPMLFPETERFSVLDRNLEISQVDGSSKSYYVGDLMRPDHALVYSYRKVIIEFLSSFFATNFGNHEFSGFDYYFGPFVIMDNRGYFDFMRQVWEKKCENPLCIITDIVNKNFTNGTLRKNIDCSENYDCMNKLNVITSRTKKTWITNNISQNIWEVPFMEYDAHADTYFANHNIILINIW